MGIHFVCHHCSYALHVKDFQAGKRGKCPHCKGSFRIPDTDASYSTAIEGGPDNTEVAREPIVLALAMDAKWFVRPPGGGQFGPAPSQMLASWIAESRVTPDSFLWREGLEEWQLASKLLPELFVDEKPETESLPKQILSVNESVDLADVSKENLELSLDGPSTISSGTLLKKRRQKRRQQWTMIIVLATISLILLGILILVLVFQATSAVGPAYLTRRAS